VRKGGIVIRHDAMSRREYEIFFERHYRNLSRLAYLLTGDRERADDVAGDALMSLWERWGETSGNDDPITYARQAVIRLAADDVKTRASGGTRGSRWGRGASGAAGGDAAIVDMRTALLALSPTQRACVALCYAFDATEDDVSRTLGMRISAVRRQTSRGAAQLTKMLSTLNARSSGRPGIWDEVRLPESEVVNLERGRVIGRVRSAERPPPVETAWSR
jgi:DNA-directed RNA polymerase specialized sigma24 family protein